jgi:WD40 repeat protein
LWSLRDQTTAVLRGHVSEVSSVQFLADDEHVATAGWDGHVILWSLSALEFVPMEAHAFRAWLERRTNLPTPKWNVQVGRFDSF